MADAFLYPALPFTNGLNGSSNFGETALTASDPADAIADWSAGFPGGTDTTNSIFIVSSGSAVYEAEMELEGLPADFFEAAGNVGSVIRFHAHCNITTNDDYISAWFDLVDSSGVSAFFSGETQFLNLRTGATDSTPSTTSLTITNPINALSLKTLAQWQNVRLRLRVEYANNMGSDGIGQPFNIFAAGIEIQNYVQAVVSTVVEPAAESLLITGQTPTWEAKLARIEPAPGSLLITGQAPQLFPANTSAGTLQITGQVPRALAGLVYKPSTGVLEIVGQVPTFSSPASTVFSPPNIGGIGAVGFPANNANNVALWNIPYWWDHNDSQFIYDSTTSNRAGHGIFTTGSYLYVGDTINPRSTSIAFAGKRETVIDDETNGIWQMANRSAGAQLPSVGWSDYASYNGDRAFQYAVMSAVDHISTASSDDYTFIYFIQKNGTDRLTNFVEVVGPVPWYHANEPENWSGNFYGRDVNNNNGWLLGKKVVGADTVPCLYQWTGGTNWSAGTDLWESADEAVDFVTDIVGWCRADVINRDRIYVAFTTRNASTNAHIRFKVLAVDLTNIAAAVSVLDDTSNYGNNRWYLSGEGSGSFQHTTKSSMRMHQTGTTSDEERCMPIVRSGSPDGFFVFRTNSSSGEKELTKAELNASDWLTPSFTRIPVGDVATSPMTIPSNPGGSYAPYSVDGWKWFVVQYNKNTDRWTATVVMWSLDIDGPLSTQHYLHTSTLDLDRPESGWTDWGLLYRNTANNDFPLGATAGTRGWGMNPLPQKPESSISGEIFNGMWVFIGDLNVNNISENIKLYFALLQDLEGVDLADASRAVSLNPDLVIAAMVKGEYKLLPSIAPEDIIGAAGAVESELSIAGRYTLEDKATQSVDSIFDLRPDIVISFEGLPEVEVAVDMDFRTSVAFEVSTLISRFLEKRTNTSYVYFGQAWTDELIGLVNTRRAGLSLPPFAEIQVARYEANQKAIDVFDIHARDMARLDTTALNDPAFSPGYTTEQERSEEVNPAVAAFMAARTRFLDDLGALVTTDNFPSATYLWSTLDWANFYSVLWEYDFGAATELYLQVGLGIGPSADDPTQDNVIFLSFGLTAYDGKPYEPFGGGGGGDTPQETPATDTRTFRSTYLYQGTSWHEEFLVFVNALRAQEGRPPVLLPDLGFWQSFPNNTTETHAQNCIDAQIIAHDSTNLPVGFQTVADRFDRAGFTVLENVRGGENILSKTLLGVLPVNDDYSTGADSIFPSPEEAYTLWYNSPGHRVNMLRDYGPAEGTAYNIIGVSIKYFSEPYTFTDEFNLVAISGAIGWALVLNNVFVEVEKTMIYRHFNTNYPLDGALIELLINSYPLTAYTDVRVDHESSYSIRVVATHTIPYVQKVTRAHRSPIQYGVRQAHTARYAASAPIAVQHTASFRVRDTVDVAADHSAVYSASVRASHKAELPNLLQLIATHEAHYEDLSRIYKEHTAPVENLQRSKTQHEAPVPRLEKVKVSHASLYEPALKAKAAHTAGLSHLGRTNNEHRSPLEFMAKVRASHVSDYTALVKVKKQHEVLFSGLNKVLAEHIAPYLTTTPVAVQFSADFDLLARNRVVAAHDSFYSIRTADSVIVGGGVALTTGGKNIEITDLVISQEEQTPAWFCRARVARIEDFVAISRGASAVVDLQGEQWVLVITETQIDRVFGELDMKLSLQSPVINLMAPRALARDYSFPIATGARDIVEELLGQVVEWNILDWVVPADRFVVSGSTPYEAALTLVNVAGALIQSKSNGVLEVRYTYPRAMNTLAALAPDHTFTDIQDNLKATEGFDFRTGVNALRLLEGEATYADSFQWVPEVDDATKGVLRAHLSPWRENVVVRSTGGPVLAGLTLQGVMEREESQFVEFTGGTARLSFPVKELVGVDWVSDSLGAVAFEAGTTSLNASALVNSGYGYAEVVYKVQSLDHYVSGSLGDSEQFIIEDGS